MHGAACAAADACCPAGAVAWWHDLLVLLLNRLTQELHKMYTSNRAYYAASTLGGLTHADQRITEDVEKFCFSISDLYSHTFKVGPVQSGCGGKGFWV